MELARLQNKNSAKLKLMRDVSIHLKRGHPWVFSDALQVQNAGPHPGLARLVDKKENFLAWGIYDPKGPLAFRVLSLEQKFDATTLEFKLEQAITLRQQFFGQNTSAYRLINGEGDFLPGLVCDLYQAYLVIKLDGQGLEHFWNLEGLAAFFTQKLKLKGVYYKTRDKKEDKVLSGEIPQNIAFEENGVRFTTNVREGSKTGFFLDQRDNRQIIGQFAAQKNVLNLFSYTGGFSLYAGRGGAQHVTSVDIAPKAVDLCQEHWLLNGLKAENHQGVAQDVFAFVEEAYKEKRKWDLIIVDPPSFAPSAQTLKDGSLAYQKVFAGALKLLKEDGLIAFSSCSSHVDHNLFLEICREALSLARKRGQVLRVSGQGIDHPYPLVSPELRYLKFALFRVF